MGGNSDSEFFYIPKCILGTLGTICHGQKTGNHWIGQKRLIFIRGALTNGATVASKRWKERKKLFFQTAISRELSDWGTKSGS